MSINYIPSISVIIPVFNEADYIDKCITSILKQDYSGKIEILCIDGMSDDGTREIIKNLAMRDNNVRMIDNYQRISERLEIQQTMTELMIQAGKKSDDAPSPELAAMN